jgi:hypothetical protein
MPSDELKKLSIENSPKTPKVGDVKSKVDGTTNFYTSKDIARLQPTVSAKDMVNPVSATNPPAPKVNTNDGSRLNTLVNTTATNTQNFITSQSENAAKEKEIASLLGTQSSDGAIQREQLGEEYELPANLSRLTDIQTQLTQANTASDITKSRIEGAAGQTLGQSQREVTQQDKENAIRTAGLAAEANVLQGNIETASTLINQAMSDYYQDRSLTNQNMIQQLNYYSGKVDQETQQLIDAETRKYEEDQSNIKRAQTLVDSAVSNGYLSASEMKDVLAITDPKLQADRAQIAIASGIERVVAEAKAEAAAAASNAGFDSPETKNFGTNDAPIWKQWNATTGNWEDVTGVAGGSQLSAEETQKSIDQLTFLRTVTKDATEIANSGGLFRTPVGPSGINRAIGAAIVGNTSFQQLQNKTDTLKTNVLSLMTDPSIRKFFGPQMSNADVQLIQATGSTLDPMRQNKADYVKEIERLDDLLNRMQTAVKRGQSGMPSGVQGPVQPVNIITAPDGTQIELID